MRAFDRLRASRGSVLFAAAALVGVIAVLDYRVGTEISFSIFYLLPVAFASWWGGRREGLLISGVSAAMWFLNETVWGGRAFSHPLIPYWNAAMRGAIFGITSSLLVRLHASLRKERDASRLKTEMLALVSHEFGNSLAILSMGVVLLKEGDGGAGSADRLILYEMLERNQDALKQTVANFLNNARMETGKFQLNLQRTDLRALVNKTLEALDLLARHKNITVERDFRAEAVLLRADPDCLSLVLTNLVGNAIKYTPAGGRVAVRLSPVGPGPAEVMVSVEDTGIGIAAEDQKRIFSGFYRTASGMAEARGFGVGLKVAGDILEAHGSRLRVESSPGSGSQFSFTLPAAPAEPSPAPLKYNLSDA